MEQYLVDEITYRGHTIKIYQDPDPESPRIEDNLGKMVCFHKRYVLGDEHNLMASEFEGWSQIEGHLLKECNAVIILPLYLYDHSGLRIKISNFYGLLPQGHAEFDSGQVGFIYATRGNIRKHLGVRRITKSVLERTEKILEAEVDTYDKYISGQVFGYLTEDADGEDVDSCWGYFGTEDLIEEAKREIDALIKVQGKN